MRNPNLRVGVCRWTARIIGTLFVAMFVMFAIGEGMPGPRTMFPWPPTSVTVYSVAFLLILTGFLAGWRWEIAGGIMATIGSLLLVGAAAYWQARFSVVVLLVLLVPGPLYLASAMLRRYRVVNSPA
jgi:hypothetical protein